MTYDSAASEKFLAPVRLWLEASGEVLVMIRFSYAGGSKSFEFFHTFADFERRVQGLPSRTCIIVFRNRQLPLRGTIDPGFISSALAMIPEGTEWVDVSLKLTTAGARSWFHDSDGTTHAELIAELEDHMGETFAVGPCPAWLVDSEAVVSAVVPEIDGTVVTGSY